MTALGIVGASARAAAMSALRAGFTPWAVDLFADRDLRHIARTVRCAVHGYPNALPLLSGTFPYACPVLYTGGLENHPAVVRELAARHKLWGNSPEVLELVRKPQSLIFHSQNPRVASLDIVPASGSCPSTGSWVRKRFHSAGGMGIRFAEPGEPPSPHHFFQRFANGLPMSMLFGRREGNAVHQMSCLGVTEQLIGEPWLHAEPFAYCGNIGPVELPDVVRDGLVEFASQLAERYELRGMWGLDFVFDDTTAYPVEVNPRYTASVEVIELATHKALLTDHARDFRKVLPEPREGGRHGSGVVGKAIYFAPHAIRFPQSGPWDYDLRNPIRVWRIPTYADIPDTGSVIEAGQPVFTFFTSWERPEEVRDALQSQAAELDTLFAEHTP